MASQEVARREAGMELAVPKSLRELGVKLVDHGGMRAVVIPEDVRKRVNVLMPVQSFAAALPDFTPSVRLVELDVEQHSYNNAAWGRSKRALNKQGLEILADVAGVFRMKTGRVPRAELHEGERFAYWSEIAIRQHDGTIKVIRREKGYEEEAEKQEIRDAVERATKQGGGKKFDTEAKRDAEFQKRWLTEQKNAAAKTESKAVLRAIRAALQIPHQFDEKDLKRPFLVIGYSFTPDYSDPEVRRLLVQHGLGQEGAAASVYGHELEAGTIVHAAELAEPDDEAPQERPDASEEEPEPEEPTDEEHGEEPGQEDLFAGEPSEPEPDDEELAKAKAVAMNGGKFEGQTLGEILEAGNGWYISWLAENFNAQEVRDAAQALVDAGLVEPRGD